MTTIIYVLNGNWIISSIYQEEAVSTKSRVPDHTSAVTNDRIRGETRKKVEYYLANPQEIDQRLNKLNEEWDIERTLEVNSSLVSLFGLAMGFAVNKRWFLLPFAVQSFFLQHAVQGWCPPLPVLRGHDHVEREAVDTNLEPRVVRRMIEPRKVKETTVC